MPIGAASRIGYEGGCHDTESKVTIGAYQVHKALVTHVTGSAVLRRYDRRSIEVVRAQIEARMP